MQETKVGETSVDIIVCLMMTYQGVLRAFSFYVIADGSTIAALKWA